jgi:asparagine synthase (glutamine-hydrolysing)
VCGIVGIVARRSVLATGVLERATESLAHRGPDDQGTVIFRQSHPEPIEVGLGNRRLAILDLSPLGHQPMEDPETGNWIVHNGEIYNFREIRSKLEAEGVSFVSHSDTEVILKAYGRWGEKSLQQFRGMFAFAIWDVPRRRLFLARDQMGIKPLYYCQSEQNFVFASEVRTVLGTGLVPSRLDEAGLLNYLTFGSVYEPNTLIAGILALAPGCFLTWEKGETRIERYWDLAPLRVEDSPRLDQNAVPPTRRQSEKLVYETLDESVLMQLVSDVPVGVFLSGGIDSSALVGILGRSGRRPSTFSIVFREAEYSEREHSRAVAELFQTDHHEINVSQHDALTAIPAALRAMDQPTIDGVNTYFVSQHARAAGVKVALSGLGGDEVFAGYSSFRTVPRMERFANVWGNVPRVARNALAKGFRTLLPTTDQNRKLSALVKMNGGLLHPYFLSRMLFTPGSRARLLRTPDKESIERATTPLLARLDETNELDPINRVSYLESRCYMLNTLLRDSDSMSMAHGLEVRVPLIDHRLVHQVMALPGAWKIRRGDAKPLLVSALRGTLPASIVHRPKRGFTLPFEHWLRGALQSEVQRTISSMAESVLGSILNADEIRRVWYEFQGGHTSWSRPWSLFVLHRWCETHL